MTSSIIVLSENLGYMIIEIFFFGGNLSEEIYFFLISELMPVLFLFSININDQLSSEISTSRRCGITSLYKVLIFTNRCMRICKHITIKRAVFIKYSRIIKELSCNAGCHLKIIYDLIIIFDIRHRKNK